MKFPFLPLLLLAATAQAQTWQTVQTRNEATPRHENAATLENRGGGPELKSVEVMK